MGRIAYVNGRYVPHESAYIHIEDRGYQFSDGVYEGIGIRRGQLIDLDEHLDRLDNSLKGLQISQPMSRQSLKFVLMQLCKKNKTRDGFLYLQITRGVARRDHPFPAHTIKPAMTATVKRLDYDAILTRAHHGISVCTVEDQRWKRRDIKSISLLPNILAKQEARKEGFFEAVQINQDNFITEGSSTNIWMIDHKNTLLTHPVNQDILNGITRCRIITLAQELQIPVKERPFTVKEALCAKEMFLSSTTAGALPITKIDNTQIANGQAGPISLKLAKAYITYMDTR